MISGSIKIHEEPEKAKKTTAYSQAWDYMYENWDKDAYALSSRNWQELDNELQKHINAGTIKGLIIGARVKRISGTPGIGTITRIHRTHTMAWNHTNHELEPFTVTWDKTNPHNGGTFDYSAEDIEVAKELPSVLKKGEIDEALSDFYESY